MVKGHFSCRMVGRPRAEGPGLEEYHVLHRTEHNIYGPKIYKKGISFSSPACSQAAIQTLRQHSRTERMRRTESRTEGGGRGTKQGRLQIIISFFLPSFLVFCALRCRRIEQWGASGRRRLGRRAQRKPFKRDKCHS